MKKENAFFFPFVSHLHFRNRNIMKRRYLKCDLLSFVTYLPNVTKIKPFEDVIFKFIHLIHSFISWCKDPTRPTPVVALLRSHSRGLSSSPLLEENTLCMDGQRRNIGGGSECKGKESEGKESKGSNYRAEH